MKKMNSINETAKLCKEHEIGISRKLLLQLAKSGAIPCIKAGRSILINWEGLMKYLDFHKIDVKEETSSIRRISS
ncbi:MAG: hypothetical protein PUB66_06730 [Oscillospiraceae bacterium]|nr:hypothetical protein [Oscillospiraceae bacterium]